MLSLPNQETSILGTLKPNTEKNQLKLIKMKFSIIAFSYFLLIACGVHTLTSSLNEITERDCANSGNPYSSACVYLSTRGK